MTWLTFEKMTSEIKDWSNVLQSCFSFREKCSLLFLLVSFDFFMAFKTFHFSTSNFLGIWARKTQSILGLSVLHKEIPWLHKQLGYNLKIINTLLLFHNCTHIWDLYLTFFFFFQVLLLVPKLKSLLTCVFGTVAFYSNCRLLFKLPF